MPPAYFLNAPTWQKITQPVRRLRAANSAKLFYSVGMSFQ